MIVRPLGVLVLVALLATVLSSCSATGVTSARVDAAVGPTFSRLYTVQQRQLGEHSPRTAPDTARCHRSNAASPQRGAGDDWLCVVDFPFPDGHVQPIFYDLHVQPTGCYTADGPMQIVGRQQQRGPDGALVTNPLFEFDGCFDVT